MGTGLMALLVLLSVGFSQESLDFSPTEVCTAWVDSVWFSEETLPNDSNIVEICYSLESNCPDSAFEISVSISADSGTIWVSAGEGWFSTLMDTAGALGTVSPGTHCFSWLMNEDIAAEQSNWLIRATVYFHRELTMFWTMFHYDAQNTGRSPYVLCSDESLSILWSIDAGAPINYSAVSCGPTIYFATSDGVLHAVKYDGTVLWTASTGASTRAGPAVLEDGSVILGNSDGTMTCFNTDGTVRWTWTSSLSVSPCGLWHCPSIGPDGRIRTAGNHGGSCWEGSLICLGQDGTFYWERDIPAGGDGTRCSPAVDLYNLSFTTDIGNDPCGALTCYNTDGTIRWRWNGYPHTGEVDIGSSPTIDVVRNRIYFGTNRSSKGLVAVDYDPSGTSHSMAWFYGTNPRDINWCPAIDWDGNIYIGTNDGGTGTSILFSFAPDGSVRWADSINCGSISDPVVDSAGHIIVGASNGYLYVFNTDGDSLTSVYLGGRVNSPILGTGGNIYVGTNANRFYAVGCEIFEPRDSSTSAVSGPLDSSPPSIELVCPTGTYHPGDTVHIEWTIEDSFLLSSSCSLRIYLCERETTFAISGTETDFAIPAESYGCDSIYFEIVAGDSFGNISSAQCGIAVACSVWIDSVWFSEETDCNDSNIVQICYILNGTCPESTYNITVSISIDSGASWVPAGSLWFSTLYDTGGDLGAVSPGTHCFYWVISSDTSNVETENAMIKVELHDTIYGSTAIYWIPYVFNYSSCPSGSGNKITIAGVYPGTNVSVDFNHDGTVDTSFTIDVGDFVSLSRPDILAGTKITTDKRVEIDYYFRCSNDGIYEDGSLLYSIYPTSIIGSEYAVPPADSTVILATENLTTVNVDLDYSGTTDTSFTLNAGEYAIISTSSHSAHIFTGGEPIYVLNFGHAPDFYSATYAYLLLPIDKLDTIYYAPRTHPYSLSVISRNSKVIVVATEDLTNITINGTPYTADAGDVINYVTEDSIVINADREVEAVYISDVTATDPWGGATRDYMYAFQLFPANLLAQRYILSRTGSPPSSGGPKVQYSIISFASGDTIKVDVSDDSSIDTSFILGSGQIGYITESYSPIRTNFFSVTSISPVQVTKSYRGWWSGTSETCHGKIICSGEYTSVTLDTTVVATGPLDSRGPSTDLVCPDTFFLIGDTVNLSWSVSDLFWNHLPGSLFVNYCGPETVIAVEDSSISFVIPDYFAGCDSMLLTLAVRDSFCNWGYDTCTIPIITCVPATAWLVCPYSESLTITSCNDQNVTFAILDTSGFPIDTTRVFIHKQINGEYHPVPIDSLTFYYIGDTLFITIPGIYSDNDTISVALDSVFNIAGCPTRF